MQCPKCKRSTTVLVTEQNKKTEREFQGLFWLIILAPFRLIRFLWRCLFGRKQEFRSRQHWHCNYCSHNFRDETHKELAD
jgi:transposase-like protein